VIIQLQLINIIIIIIIIVLCVCMCGIRVLCLTVHIVRISNIRNTTRFIRIWDLDMQLFHSLLRSVCKPELIASENNVRINGIRTVGKVMAA